MSKPIPTVYIQGERIGKSPTTAKQTRRATGRHSQVLLFYMYDSTICLPVIADRLPLASIIQNETRLAEKTQSES